MFVQVFGFDHFPISCMIGFFVSPHVRFPFGFKSPVSVLFTSSGVGYSKDHCLSYVVGAAGSLFTVPVHFVVHFGS